MTCLMFSQAEQLVLSLRDLFQVVYEMKKAEVDGAKEKMTLDGEGNSSTPGSAGSTSGTGQVSHGRGCQGTRQVRHKQGCQGTGQVSNR